jgi:DNA (cytosine-5)-methyltransferase 1
LVEWLRQHFGHGAASKLIPGWALGIDPELRGALLAGYLSGDGCLSKGDGTPLVMCSTVSKALAFGLKALASSLGHSPAVYVRTNQPDVIEGRKVNVLPAWSVCWRPEPERAQSFRDGGLNWAPVRKSEDVEGMAEVFNISVEDDESYVVEDIIVHNCTFHSKARGGKPHRDRDLARRRRALAWVVAKWAKHPTARPRVIIIENVEEFQHWGPLLDDGMPDPERRGQSFERWVAQLRNAGYKVEWRELRACDFGAPTIRKRLFIIARRDGLPIVWPEASHVKPDSEGRVPKGKLPWRTAAECIDWSIPCPSIFERKKPLADATLRRIAKGLVRYVIDADKPFIVRTTQGEPENRKSATPSGPAREPGSAGCSSTDRQIDLGGAPFIVTNTTGHPGAAITEPVRTVTTGGHHALVVPTLIQVGYGERPSRWQCSGCGFTYDRSDLPVCGCVKCGSEEDPVERPGQSPRVPGLDKPLGTVVTGQKHALVTAFLAKHYTGVVGSDLAHPLGTVTTIDHHSFVAVHMTKFNTGSVGYAADSPVHTITAGGKQARPGTAITQGVVAAHLVHMGHGEGKAGGKRFSHGIRDVKDPLNTITAQGAAAGVVTTHMIKMRGDNVGSSSHEPLHTISAQGLHHGIVSTFLAKWAPDAHADVSLPVLVTLDGEVYAVVDIGLRMLTPKELYRAQGFPENYAIEHGADGRPLTKTAQVRMCGNSVSPPNAAALVMANYSDLTAMSIAA